jgi:excinuclease UvrABC ATPase subunit
VRASTTGMLYVLDEPSVGLHPSNVQGLLKTITTLARNGNSVVVVEHERELIRSAVWVIELGPRPVLWRNGDRPGAPRPAGNRPALDHGSVPGRRRGRAV